MKIAYIITAHKYPDQLIRLVERLNTKDAHFFIHIDKNSSDDVFLPIFNSFKSHNNIVFLRRNTSSWGDFGITKAIIKGVDAAVQHKASFDYYIYITGQDYPIKSNQQIQDFLAEHKGKSFINYFPSSHPWVQGWEDRIRYWNIKFFKYRLKFPKVASFNSPVMNTLWNSLVRKIPFRRKLPYGLTPFFGSAYWCLTDEIIKYIYAYYHRRPRYVRFFKHVPLSEEIFFQTILANSPLVETLVNDDLVRTDFSAHRPHPSILRKDDFEKLMQSPNLFARKFDISVDSEILDMIDNVILSGD